MCSQFFTGYSDLKSFKIDYPVASNVQFELIPVTYYLCGVTPISLRQPMLVLKQALISIF